MARIFSSSVRAGGVRGGSSSPARVVPSDDEEAIIRPPEPNMLGANPADETLAPASGPSKRRFSRLGEGGVAPASARGSDISPTPGARGGRRAETFESWHTEA